MHQGAMAETDLLFPADDSTDTKPAKGPVLPANLEAEAAFLGAVLIDNKVIEELTTPLMAEHFHEPVHQRIYAVSYTHLTLPTKA